MKEKGSAKSGTRVIKTRVKTAKKRKISSTRWLERQLNDIYVHEAQLQGFRARSAFKLIEIDDKYHFLKPGLRVIDLGAAPGSWSQVCVQRVGSSEDNPGVAGIDLLEVEALAGARFVQMDFNDEMAPQAVMDLLGVEKVDIVLSDMAAATTGHRKTDHLRTVYLFELAVQFARDFLVPGGVFLAKVFRGGAEQEILGELKHDFGKVYHIKPPASRAESPELYLLARDFQKSGNIEGV